MNRFLIFFSIILFMYGCLKPMEEPQAEKIDSEVECGFGSSGC